MSSNLADRPYNPESQTQKRQVHTKLELLWDLNQRLVTSASGGKSSPDEQYRTLKNLCATAYGLFGENDGSVPKGHTTEEWQKDKAEIERLFQTAAEDTIPPPPFPEIQPLAFRAGLAQYDVIDPETDQSIFTVFENALPPVLKFYKSQLTEERMWQGVNRLMLVWGKFQWFLAKYRIWDITTRIYTVESGYDSGLRASRLKTFSDIGERTRPDSSSEDEMGDVFD